MLIHLDADAFYVSVEQAERPELRGKAVAVGGLHRGIIASASYEARRAGVYTPMPSAKARQVCPGLIMVRGDMNKYSDYSRRMFAIVEDFTPVIERTSIDEGYFDVSGHRTLTSLEIGRQMKQRIHSELGITVSLGIASNKLVAQIASKLRKPDALVEVPAGTEREFLAPLSSNWLPGVGAKLEARLREIGLTHIRDVAIAPPELLALVAGSFASRLQILALGIDDREVIVEHDDAKSYGMQDTFGEDLRDVASVLPILQGMADKLMSRVRRDRKAIRTVTVKVRYPDFTDTSHGITLPQATDLETDIYPHLKSLLRGAWTRKGPIRLASLRFSNVTDPTFQTELQLDSKSAQRSRQRDIAKLMDEMRAKSLPVKRGHSL